MASPVTQHAVLVPAQHVKTVKTFLEEHRILDKSRKISPHTQKHPDGESSESLPGTRSGKQFLVPLLPRVQDAHSSPEKSDSLSLEEHFGELSSHLASRLGPDIYSNLTITSIAKSDTPQRPTTQQTNPLRAAFHDALTALPPATLSTLSLTADQLSADIPATYTIYPPLLLLPAHTFRQPSWTTFLAAHPPTSSTTAAAALLAHVATTMGVTHIALNAPIAANTTETDPATAQDNILRSPTHLTPLHGSFGPRPAPARPIRRPTQRDFARAFWASARQNGVAQAWAPLHTMFSRGNVKEKARILGLASVAEAVRQGGGGGGGRGGVAAVDLYAGIGYFAFSYRRAGVAKVLGWEINAWSVEGLRRGAGRNGWAVGVVDGDGDGGAEGEIGDELLERDFVVFLESNERAAARVERLRGRVPPVRHVNAGLLPTSKGAWETTVRVLDPEMGGWVHLHENFGAGEVEERAGEVLSEVRRIWRMVKIERTGSSEDGSVDGEGGDGEAVRLEHVERVKTYAPGVLHCVLDIWIPPTGSNIKM